MRTRALVQRHGRKQHFATLAPGDTVWLAVCNLDVPVFGAQVTGRDDWNTWLTTAQNLDSPLCSRCRTPLLVASLALAEQADIQARFADIDALETEVRELRAERATWTTAALHELRRKAAR